MSHLHHLSTGGAAPSDVFAQQPGRCKHGNRVGSAAGGEHLCGPCEDGEPASEPDDVEDGDENLRCAVCGEPDEVDDPIGHFKAADRFGEYVMAHGQCGEDAGLELD